MPRKVNFATYPQDYYTGAQVRIYFGSIWVDDIATMQYQTSHSKAPLYGYADHQFRAVAKGQFLVRGSFTVAFKETGYLYQIMRMWREDKSGLDRIKKLVPTANTGGEAFLQMVGNGSTIEGAIDNMKSQQDFEDAAEIIENAIWGKPGSAATYGDRIPRSDELDYFKHINKSEPNNSDIDRDGFDILLTFGNYKAGNDTPEHTMISINDVHITGESMVVSPSAEPIGISYEFFARGLNEKVSNAWPVVDKTAAQDASKDNKSPIEQKAGENQKAQNDVKPDVLDPGSQNVPYLAPSGVTKDFGAGYTDLISQPGVTPVLPDKPADPVTGVSMPSTPEQAQAYIEGLKRAAAQKQSNEVIQSIKNPKPTEQKKPTTQKETRSFPPPGKYSATFTVKGDPKTTLDKAKNEAHKATILGISADVNIEGDIEKGTVICNDNTWYADKRFSGRYTMIGNKIQIDLDNIPTLVTWSAVQGAMGKFFQ